MNPFRHHGQLCLGRESKDRIKEFSSVLFQRILHRVLGTFKVLSTMRQARGLETLYRFAGLIQHGASGQKGVSNQGYSFGWSAVANQWDTRLFSYVYVYMIRL